MEDKQVKKICCPMVLSVDRLDCLEEKCAWWVREINYGSDYSACAVTKIAKELGSIGAQF